MQPATCDSAVSGVNSMSAVVTALLAAAEHGTHHLTPHLHGVVGWLPQSTLFQGTGSDPRASSSLRRNPALPASMHMPCTRACTCTRTCASILGPFRRGGAGSLGCGQAGEKVPPARFGSVRVGRMWACSSKLAVQERASPWLYKSSPRVARVYHAAFSSGLPSLFHSSLLVPLPKPYLNEDWFGPDSIVLLPSLCA